MSSSPLPSPSAIEHQPPKGAKSGSKMAPIPVDAPTGFLSAMSLVTDEQLQQAQTLRSNESSKTSSPSLEETSNQEPSKPSKRAATGKLKKPTKRSSTSTAEMPSDAPLDLPKAKPALRRRASKTTTVTVDLTEGDQIHVASPAPKRGRKKATTTVEDADSASLPAPAPPKRGRKKTIADSNSEEADDTPSLPKQPRRKPTKAASVVNDADNVDIIHLPESLEQTPKRRVGRPKKTIPAPVTESENANYAAENGSVIVPSENEQRNISLHDVSEPIIASPSDNNHADAFESLDLESAPHRKQSWTPPLYSALPPSFQTPSFHEVDERAPLPDDLPTEADTSGLEANMSGSATESTTKPSDAAGQPSRQPSFAELVNNFEYQPGMTTEQSRNENNDYCAQLAPTEPKEQEPTPVVPKKKGAPRKKSEPKEKPDSKEKAAPKPRAPRKKAEPKPKVPKEPKPKIPKKPKPKAPKKTPKKPLTITALATAAYRQQPLQALQESGSATLESYLISEPAKLIQGTEEGDQAGTAPPKLRKRKSTGDKPASKRSKKDAAPEYRLQSPETAHQSLKNQDWLFGTSSQLAAAESPSEYRDLQRAIKESEELISSQAMEGSQVIDLIRTASRSRVPSAPHGTDLSIGQANRDLWLSAARDVVDGTYAADNRLSTVSEELQAATMAGDDEVLPAAVPPQGLLEKPSSDDEEAQDSGYVDIDDVLKYASAAKPSVDDADTPQMIDAGADSIVTRAILQPLDLNMNLSKQATDLDKAECSPPKQTVENPTKDDFPTIVNLLTPPKKPRGRPRLTVTDIDLSQKRVIDATASPRRRGRGQSPISPHTSKDSSKRQPPSSPYLDIDDISDAEAAASPPSPPKRKRRSPIIQRTLELSNPTAIPPAKPRSEKQLQADWPTISITLFPKITATVKAQPPTVDLKDPSWYEKMLLYDPIVLEDLTAWLHGQGLRIESERPKAVQRPKKKKIVDGEQTKESQIVEMEMVSEELRPWMVQKWCEEHSICCLWKEGLRGGVRQRY